MRYFSSYLMYARAGRPTGKEIARVLGVEGCGIRAPVNPPDILVRWGSRKVVSWPVAVEVNPVEAISMASDKIRACEALSAVGISTPPLFRTFAEAKTYCERNGGAGIIFGRSRRGMQGKDIKVYAPSGPYNGQYPETPPADAQHEFYTVWIESRREVRIHVCDGHVIRVQGKYQDHPGMQTSPFIRNFANGYRFRAPKQDLHRSRKKAAIKAVETLGLHFGAVDMLLTGYDEGGMVLEVNTAPACSPLTLRCYTASIALVIERMTGGEAHFAPDIMESEVRLDYDLDESNERESYLG